MASHILTSQIAMAPPGSADLNELALQRGQSLAQMAVAWLLKDERLTSVLVGARNSAQLTDSLKSLENLSFSQEELKRIEVILSST